ncbi:MAG: SCO family protein [Gammaproteobacteria bacterium]|nr:SCO family protein [Gammaproteobacteria bacterium]
MRQLKASLAFIAMLLLGLATACSRDEGFHAKSIAGLMPPLEFSLTSDEGNAASAQDTAGKIRLLFFGYTSCPDICPVTLGRLGAVIQGLPEERREQVRVLFVSVDPQRDSVAKLHAYVDYFGDQVIGLRGPEPALRKLAQRYRTTFGYGDPDETGFYEVSHSSGIYVFDGSGAARLLFRSDDPLAAMQDDLRQLLDEAG